MLTFSVATAKPYNFAQMAARLKKYEKSTYQERDGQLWRTVRLNGIPLLLAVRFDEPAHRLCVTVFGHTDDSVVCDLKNTIARMFSTDVDLSNFYRHVAGDGRIAPLTKRFAGLRIVREPDLFECLVKTIISQQLNMAFAGTLVRRFVKLAGDVLAVNGENWPVFPTPEQVAHLKYEQLQALQFNRRKAEYIIDIARKIVDGSLDLERLWHLTDEEVLDELTKLRGIGRWTVECLLLFGLGRADLLPAADIGLRNAVRRVYGLAHQPREAEVREIGRVWSPWSSYVTFYVWEALSVNTVSS